MRVGSYSRMLFGLRVFARQSRSCSSARRLTGPMPCSGCSIREPAGWGCSQFPTCMQDREINALLAQLGTDQHPRSRVLASPADRERFDMTLAASNILPHQAYESLSTLWTLVLALCWLLYPLPICHAFARSAQSGCTPKG
jgi:hypothetical protein